MSLIWYFSQWRKKTLVSDSEYDCQKTPVLDESVGFSMFYDFEVIWLRLFVGEEGDSGDKTTAA